VWLHSSSNESFRPSGLTRFHRKWPDARQRESGVPALLVLGAVGYALLRGGRNAADERAGGRVAGVEVATVERRALEEERTFSGAMEAASEFVAAPKVGGRIDRLAVDLADPVQRGQEVAFLDDAEIAQAVKRRSRAGRDESQLCAARNRLGDQRARESARRDAA